MIDQMVRPATLAIVILTYNEEINLPQALNSVAGWANQIFILDSLSTDGTLEIARSFNCQIAQNKFENYAKQRNYALDHLPIDCEWVLFLDADEWLPDSLKEEISSLISASPKENGFYIKRRFIWHGQWLRHGYYPSWLMRLFRYGKGRCEDRTVNEHLIVDGLVGYLRNDFIHEDGKGVTEWIAKHNRYATMEAIELMNTRTAPVCREIDVNLFGTQSQRKRWLRNKIWNRMPPLVRPFFFFFYRYVLAGGFLDGREAFIYHFFQALWFPMLIDVKYLELLSLRRRSLHQ